MSPKSLASRHSIDSCLFQLHTWKLFSNSHSNKTLDSDFPVINSSSNSSNPYPNNKHSSSNGLQPKRPCLSDRATSLFSLSIDNLDFSKLSLFDDGSDKPLRHHHRDRFLWMARKRRRRGSRSVSGRSSDRSGTHNGRCCSVGATATATCSDFMMGAGGTDSSGELFVNGNGNGNDWASDVSEARRDKERGERSVGERENSFSALGFGFGFDAQGSESGYGSEPGYRGDAEFGYGDEVDDEEEDGRLLLWGERFRDNVEKVDENFSEQKAHHRGRRKKHDWRMIDAVR